MAYVSSKAHSSVSWAAGRRLSAPFMTRGGHVAKSGLQKVDKREKPIKSGVGRASPVCLPTLLAVVIVGTMGWRWQSHKEEGAWISKSRSTQFGLGLHRAIEIGGCTCFPAIPVLGTVLLA